MTATRFLALATAVATYALILLGGWVRANNAGLSCPDWPTCYGHWVLTPAQFAALGDVGYTYYEMMLEWTHRFLAGFVVGPLILILAIVAWRGRHADPRGFAIAMGLLLLLLFQASLGGFTVLDRNSPWSVALHLGTALVILSLLVLIAQRAAGGRMNAVSPLVLTLVCAGWILAIGAMVTAAMTAKSGASLACWEWPSCDGSWFPSLDDPFLRIHFIHRAFAASCGMVLLLLLACVLVGAAPGLRRAVLSACLLVVVQIGLGALVILFEVPLWSQVAHQATGVLLFVVLSSLLWSALRGGRTKEWHDAGLPSPRSAI